MLLHLTIPFLVAFLLSVHAETYHLCCYLISKCTLWPLDNNRLVSFTCFSLELHKFFWTFKVYVELHFKTLAGYVHWTALLYMPSHSAPREPRIGRSYCIVYAVVVECHLILHTCSISHFRYSLLIHRIV